MIGRHATAMVTLKDAEPGDWPAIAAIHVASWRDAYASLLDPAYLAGPVEAERRAVWAERMATPRADQIVIVARGGEGPIGFCCLFADEDPRWGALLDNLHVLPAARGKGIGETLLRAGVGRLAGFRPDTGLHLWVYEANLAARRFYERLGARTVERRPDDFLASGGKPILRMHWPAPADLPARADGAMHVD